MPACPRMQLSATPRLPPHAAHERPKSGFQGSRSSVSRSAARGPGFNYSLNPPPPLQTLQKLLSVLVRTGLRSERKPVCGGCGCVSAFYCASLGTGVRATRSPPAAGPGPSWNSSCTWFSNVQGGCSWQWGCSHGPLSLLLGQEPSRADVPGKPGVSPCLRTGFGGVLCGEQCVRSLPLNKCVL